MDIIIQFINSSNHNTILLLPIGPPGSGKTTLINSIKPFIKNRLVITPWHPILNENVWKFPNQLLNSQLIKCQYVYNLILKDRKSIYVENVVCCTFGHGIEGDVIGHPFFGTDAVVNNLKNNFTNEYENGSIRSISKVIRDNNMMVCGYK